jgi:hypothetical protein
MNKDNPRWMSRRSFVVASAGFATTAALPLHRVGAAEKHEYSLVAAHGRARLIGAKNPDTAVWAYNGKVPGPEIRVR